MAEYQLSAKWVKENQELVRKAYNISIARKYDINTVEQVLEIIKEVDPINATFPNANILSKVLNIFAQQIVEKFQSKTKKPKILN